MSQRNSERPQGMHAWWVHAALFVATAASVFIVFLTSWSPMFAAAREEQVVASGLFTASVLAILLAHELGHYLMARAHGVPATLPYFLPFPLGVGTLGAVIRLKGRMPTRDALVDVGAAGPLAGLLMAVPLLVVGTTLSRPVAFAAPAKLTPAPGLSLLNLGAELGQWVRATVDGAALPEATAGVMVFGDNLLTWGVARLVHGRLPEGMDLAAHPVWLAAWFGLLMTMLNLLPVGQLDGGHLTHAWLGERAVPVGTWVARGALVLALTQSVSWLAWFFLVTKVVGTGHPPVEAPEQPLSPGRRATVVVAWVMTVLTFMPVPLDAW